MDMSFATDGQPPTAAGLRVGLAYNLKRTKASDDEAEFDEPATVEAISAAIAASGAEVLPLEADAEFPARLLKAKPDIVFNIAEGRYGRDREGQIPAILQYYNFNFTGSDSTSLGMALDKELTKRIAASYGIRSPHGQIFPVEQDSAAPAARPEPALHYPLIVKPNAEGSSKGISDRSIAHSSDELQKLVSEGHRLYHQDMLAEEYIAGREFTVALIGNGDGLRAFPPMEIAFKDGRPENVYSYEVKRDFERFISYECPARLPAQIQTEMMDMAKRAFHALGCRDLSRVDFRMDNEGRPYFIEINPLPGLAPGYSDFPMAAGFNGISYDDLIRGILYTALWRCGLLNTGTASREALAPHISAAGRRPQPHPRGGQR